VKECFFFLGKVKEKKIRRCEWESGIWWIYKVEIFGEGNGAGICEKGFWKMMRREKHGR